MLQRDASVTLGADIEIPYGEEGETITPEMLYKEVEYIAECRADMARFIFPWALEIAGYKPALFADLVAEPAVGGVR
jgi:hypothetical protein